MPDSEGMVSPIQQLPTRVLVERPAARMEPANVVAGHGAPDARGRQLQQTVSFGALGGGILLAGFGLVPALAGMVIGAGLGYWYERRAVAQQPGHQA